MRFTLNWIGVAPLLVWLCITDAASPAAPSPTAKRRNIEIKQEKTVRSQDIESWVVALGYPKSTADELTRLSAGWKYGQWAQQLKKVRGASSKSQVLQIAKVEERIAIEIRETLEKEFSYDRDSYLLSKVIRDRKASCLGYTQLFYILGNSLGIAVRPCGVQRMADGPIRMKESHVVCLLSTSDGKTIMVDVGKRLVSTPFDFKDTYVQVGTSWELKSTSATLNLHRRIRPENELGLISSLCNNKGNLFGDSGQSAKAITYFDKAIELNPNFELAYSNRAIQYGKLGEYKKAIADYGNAIRNNPNYWTAYHNRGAIFANSGRHTEAIADYSKAIEIDPTDERAFHGRGKTYARMNQFAKSLADQTTAIKLNPSFVDAYYDRGLVYESVGKFNEAIDDFSSAIELNPTSTDAYNARGNSKSSLGRNTEALVDFDKAVTIDPKYSLTYSNRGSVFVDIGEFEKAFADFNRAIALNANNAEAHANRGRALALTGKKDEARRDFQRAVELKPGLRDRVAESLKTLNLN